MDVEYRRIHNISETGSHFFLRQVICRFYAACYSILSFHLECVFLVAPEVVGRREKYFCGTGVKIWNE
jgi:hypothetical protein